MDRQSQKFTTTLLVVIVLALLAIFVKQWLSLQDLRVKAAEPVQALRAYQQLLNQ